MAQRNESLNIATGICILALCHVAFIGLCFLLTHIIYVLGGSRFGRWISYALAGIGLSQVFYAVPLWLRLNHKGLAATAKGVAIGAIITVLLNGGCFVFFFSMVI